MDGISFRGVSCYIMCGRFTLTFPDLATLALMLDAVLDEENGEYHARYNIAPQTPCWVLLIQKGRRRIRQMSWGWASTGHVPTLINARVETVAAKPLFRQAFQQNRCVVLSDGFFEWLKEGGKSRPFWFHAAPAPEKDLLHQLLPMAAIFREIGSDPNSAPQAPPAFVILTTAANPVVAPIHHRMPVILPLNIISSWLQLADISLTSPQDGDPISVQEVSSRVNSVKNDDPGCLEPASPMSPAAKQLSLF